MNNADCSKNIRRIERLREASRIFVREQGVLRAEQRGTSLTFAQGHALIELDSNGQLTVGELAEILKLNKSSTSRTLAKLREKGWIEEQLDKNDSRRKPLKLSADGRKRLAQLNAEVNQRVANAFKLLSSKEQETVVKGFELYSQALQGLG